MAWIPWASDIAKDHPDLAYAVCGRWLDAPSAGRMWLVRRALRHPAGKDDPRARELRQAARPGA